jgi:hypothetical protein
VISQVVPKESTLFGLPGGREHVVALQADHKGVCRFGDSQADRDNFDIVKINIMDLYEKAIKQNATNSSLDTSEQLISSNETCKKSSSR